MSRSCSPRAALAGAKGAVSRSLLTSETSMVAWMNSWAVTKSISPRSVLQKAGLSPRRSRAA
jgi:hypothetical protein